LDTLRLRSGDITISEDSNRSLKLWSVLCYLILHRDRAVSSAELIDLLGGLTISPYDDEKTEHWSGEETLLYALQQESYPDRSGMERQQQVLKALFCQLSAVEKSFIDSILLAEFRPELITDLYFEQFNTLFAPSLDLSFYILEGEVRKIREESCYLPDAEALEHLRETLFAP